MEKRPAHWKPIMGRMVHPHDFNAMNLGGPEKCGRINERGYFIWA